MEAKNPAMQMYEQVAHQPGSEDAVLELYEEARAQFEIQGSSISKLVQQAIPLVVHSVETFNNIALQGCLLELVILGFLIGRNINNDLH